MAKPIAFLQLPWGMGNGKRTEWSDCLRIQNSMEERMPDYYWLVSPNPELETVSLQVFHEKDFTQVQHDELVKIIQDSLKTENKNTI